MTAMIRRKPDLTSMGICLLLALGTWLLYWPVAHFGFITLDDNLYVTANPQVQAGLTWAGIKWAFQDLTASNWSPLTWLSHMLDCQLYRMNAGGHHLTNVLIHLANALLLFAWLKSATGATWRSALVAGLFAWHPLRVESVAWVAERKDVLCAFFWLLALLAYTRYARDLAVKKLPATEIEPSASTADRHPFFFYTMALLSCAAALMSKPMAVTLPFVLLLLDGWPLRRFSISDFQFPILRRLLLEKMPFLALSLAASGVNYFAQKGGGATWSLDALPLHVRLANAVVSYVRYLSKTFWPADLAVIYPYPETWPLWYVLTAAGCVLLLSGTAVILARKKPFLFVGWFYFIGVLVPVIGLVQVGPQAMADRYTYLPSIGLLVLVVWSAGEFLSGWRRGKAIAVLAGGAALCLCLIATSRQLPFWQSSVSLFAHTVEVTPDNYTATAYLGSALEAAGHADAALPFYRESVRIEPKFPIAQWSLGMALLRKGAAGEAAEHLAVAARLTPSDAVIHCYAGKAFADAGNQAEAGAMFEKALQLNPEYAYAHFVFAVSLAQWNRIAEALPHFAAAVRLEPTSPEIRFNYGLALLDNRQPEMAAEQFAVMLRLVPGDIRAHFRLAQALQQQARPAEAAAQFREALRLQPNFTDAQNQLSRLLKDHPELK